MNPYLLPNTHNSFLLQWAFLNKEFHRSTIIISRIQSSTDWRNWSFQAQNNRTGMLSGDQAKGLVRMVKGSHYDDWFFGLWFWFLKICFRSCTALFCCLNRAWRLGKGINVYISIIQELLLRCFTFHPRKTYSH